MSNESIKIKAGATFSVGLLVVLPAGAWSAASEIRKSDGTLVGALAVTLAPLPVPDASGNTHAGLLEASSVATALWPVGAWRADVKFSDASVVPVVISTESFPVVVEKAVTHG